MKTVRGTQKLEHFLLYLMLGMLVIVPFHATFTVWLASNFGHYTLFRLWIEVVIGLLFVGVVYLIMHEKIVLTNPRARWLWWFSVTYILLHILIGLVALGRHMVSLTALADALVLNLRPIAIFWLAVVITNRSNWLRDHWQQILLWPAAAVVAFGLLQHFVLPVDFLRHFGYGQQTILPYETVNQKLSLVRIMSTLRGANPFGAYLVIIVAALASLIVHAKKPKSRLILGGYLLTAFVVLFFTYSRSAWLGAGLSTATVAWFAIKSEKIKQIMTVGIALFLIIAGVGVLMLQHNNRFEEIFLHTDQLSTTIGSNQNHVSALKSGLHDVAHDPLGRGPGTAGPASAHNNHPARIAENYFVQLGQEVGILGVSIFMIINIFVGEMLWRRKDPLALMLLASLVGITFINLLSHAWTDDTLAVLWWTLAGVALAGAIIKVPTKKYEKTSKKAAVSTHPTD